MISGVDRIKRYSPMVFDSVRSTVKFNYEDIKIFLNGAEGNNILMGLSGNKT